MKEYQKSGDADRIPAYPIVTIVDGNVVAVRDSVAKAILMRQPKYAGPEKGKDWFFSFRLIAR